MAETPGTIALGKFRIPCEGDPRSRNEEPESYLLQQRAVIRLSEDLLSIKTPADCAVLWNDDGFASQAGKRPSLLQVFIASLGYCMLSQLARFARRAGVEIEKAEMELSMTYDFSGKFRPADYARLAPGLSYVFKIETAAPAEAVVRVARLADRGCHTVNTLRRRVPVAGRLLLNELEFWIGD